MKKTLLVPVSAILFAAMTLPAFAIDVSTHANVTGSVNPGTIMQVHPDANASVGASGGVTARTDVLSHLSSGAIETRVGMLENMLTRVGTFRSLSASTQATIKANIQAQIDRLKAVESGSASVSDDEKDNAYHGYLYVMTRAAVNAAANRILAVSGMLENFSAKLEARIDAVASGSTDTMKADLATMKAKTADAKVQANAALDIVTNIGDDTSVSARASVIAKLQDARAKIQAARADVIAAFQAAQKIVVALRALGSSEDRQVGLPHIDAHADVTGNANVQ